MEEVMANVFGIRGKLERIHGQEVQEIEIGNTAASATSSSATRVSNSSIIIAEEVNAECNSTETSQVAEADGLSAGRPQGIGETNGTVWLLKIITWKCQLSFGQ